MSQLLDSFVRHQIEIERAKAGEARSITSIAKSIDKEIQSLFLSLPENYTKRQLDRVLFKIQSLVKDHYAKTVLKNMQETASIAVDFEYEFSNDMLEKYLTVSGEVVKSASRQKAYSKTLNTPYDGKKLETWTKLLGSQKIKDVKRMARERSIQNEPPSKLASGVRSASKVSNNATAKVSSAYINQAVNKTRDEVYNQNESYVEELVWSSILDSKTTITCAVRSNKRYNAETKEPIGHSNEWGAGAGLIHWNCRSIALPTRKDGKFINNEGEFVHWKTGTKTAIGATKDYERGDRITKSGSIAKTPRGGKNLKLERVSAGTDYEVWLRRQPRPFIEDTLGVSKARLFIDNKVSLEKFVVENGRELTVKQLTKKLGN